MYRKYFFSVALLAVFSIKAFSSGIQVQNTEVYTNSDKKSAQIKFSVSWEHSWRLIDGTPTNATLGMTDPRNWDAAWVFIKYRTLPGDNWFHAYISTAAAATKPDMPAPAGGNYFDKDGKSEIKVCTSPAVLGSGAANPGVGAFIYRKGEGNGLITFTDVELKWEFGLNGLTGGEQVEVCVIATEMVYIPTGAFNLGDETSVNSFRRQPEGYASVPYAITAATGATNTNYNGYVAYVSNSIYNNASAAYSHARNALHSANSSGRFGPLESGGVADDWATANTSAATQATAFPAAYPSGFNAIYCMKYEITQGEYLQFLNKNMVTVKNAKTYFHLPASDAVKQRYDIIQKSGTGVGPINVEFELGDLNSSFLPCNWLGTKDILAWMVWAGLRPMTEFEFEKICRGTVNHPGTASLRPVFAWGSPDFTNTVGFFNKDFANEGPSNPDANCAVAPGAVGANANMDGPMRAGGYATPTSSRVKAGATFYGVMEMSGNLRERAVSSGNANGRTFTGIHGNGEIGNGANPQMPTGWPSLTAAGLGFRGGSYWDLPTRARVSDRQDINTNDVGRKANYGGRAVRTAP